MIPPTCLDDETLENDVRYGIDDCRRRLRSQRSTLRTQHHSPLDVTNGSMNQRSLSRLVECLLGPIEHEKSNLERATELEEAVTT